MDSQTLLVLLLILVAIAVVLLAVLVLRRPEARIGDLLERALRDEQREGRSELREQLEGLSRAQEVRIDGFARSLADLSTRTDQRITIAGPTTLLALLTSLQVGFRTVAIEKRSAEVWNILANAKREFGKFGDVMDSVKTKLEQASKQIDQTGVRTRAIERSLREVESLPSGGEPTKLWGGDEAE